MKQFEFYKKYKTSYPALENPIFTKGNFRITIAVVVIGTLLEPLILYRHFRNIPFSFHYYVQQIEYFLIFVVPVMSLIFWAYWREILKRSEGYRWVGKFEVKDKQQSLFNHFYLALSPGNNNKLKVERSLFNKIRVGDSIIVHRDVFGNVEEIKKISSFSSRVAKVRDRIANRNAENPAQYSY